MPAGESFEYPVKIREGHLDTFGHVNNAVYLQLFEEARWDILNGRGYGMDKIRATRLGPVILEVTLKFKKEITLHQQIVIRSQLKSYEGKIALFEQSMINESGDVCCSAMFTFGLFDLKSRKLVDPTPDWMRAIGGS